MADHKELAKLFPQMKRNPLTNYDRIISKTPEEMAKALNDIQCTCYTDGMFSAPIEKYPSTYSGWLDWLNSTAEDEK